MRPIANSILGFAKGVSAWSSNTANAFVGISKAIASFDNSELCIIIDQHDFTVRFLPANHSSIRSWDNLYPSGNIFFDEYANPVKIRPPDHKNDDIDVIPSGKYRMAMETNVIEQAFDTGTPGLDLIHKLLIANIGVIVLFGLIGLVMLQ